MKILPAIVVCLILLTGGVFAQKTKKTATKFSSVYTNLNKDCKTLGGGEGQDDAFDCRGAGGYRIDITPSAAVLSISARTPDKEDSIPLASQDMGFDQTKIKLEWRTANSKPFAIIMRVAKYGEPDDENPYLGKKIGEELIVKGLKGFENIDFAVDAKTPDANTKARELADKNFADKSTN
jgi:hypothetical protein